LLPTGHAHRSCLLLSIGSRHLLLPHLLLHVVPMRVGVLLVATIRHLVLLLVAIVALLTAVLPVRSTIRHTFPLLTAIPELLPTHETSSRLPTCHTIETAHHSGLVGHGLTERKTERERQRGET
jgi:hypothetical protein